MVDSLTDAAYFSFLHFKNMDEANAAIHCAPVRYSPITFRLAEALEEHDYFTDDTRTVMLDKGQYEEDRGR